VIRKIKEIEPTVRIVVGLSNISFGLPKRNLLNSVFLSLCVREGVDALILDPTDRLTMSVLSASKVLLGIDEYCSEYISLYRKGEIL
jgi:5-methyltetrahydrofolate--homocysteine methyltransferase